MSDQVNGTGKQETAGDRQRWPRAVALAVAEEIRAVLAPCCSRVMVAGSLRRGRAEVGDVELVYVTRFENRQVPGDMFSWANVALAEVEVAYMETLGLLARRKNVRGYETYGPKNKLMVHCATGVPVDLFATTECCWWNYLVCRTGPAASNIRIAQAAQRRGWQWNPYSVGFSTDDAVHVVGSEEEVFRFVGLPCLEPEER
jgi:DNA polymerase/3'-5' exonuclease PolX